MALDLSVTSFARYLGSTRPENTVDAYSRGARLFAAYVQESRMDVRRTPGVLMFFAPWLLHQRKLAPSSVRLMISGTRKYLEWRRGMGDNLPVFAKPDLPRPKKMPPIILQDAALQVYRRIVETAREPTRTAMLLFPLTGLRSTELCTIRLDQIRRDNEDPDGKRMVLVGIEGKSKEDRDVAVLDPGSLFLYGYLMGWRRTIEGSPWLFPSIRDAQKAYAGRTLRKKMGQARAAVGVPKLTTHVLRRTWTTRLVKHGIPMEEVAQLAGHQSINTTYQYYVGREPVGALAAKVQDVKIF